MNKKDKHSLVELADYLEKIACPYPVESDDWNNGYSGGLLEAAAECRLRAGVPSKSILILTSAGHC